MMGFTDLLTSRFTFGARFNDPQPITAATVNSWLTNQMAATATDDPAVMERLANVQLPISITASDGTVTTTIRGLTDLFQSSQALWAIYQADTTANRAESARPAQEVAAARWIRAAFSPWQVQEVMVDFWHNHFSVDSSQTTAIAAMWPPYDAVLRSNALGNFRSMLGATAKSAAMMYYLNQNASVAAHPNENYAREVMELHTLGIARYLGETAPANLESTGYSDSDVTNAARVLTGWTIADGHQKAADGSMPNTGDFLFNAKNHDTGVKTLFGQTYPAGVGQAEGESFLDTLAAHPGTAQTIATKLYVHFVQDVPPANDPLVQSMATVFQQNVKSPNQIALVLLTLAQSPEFAASAGAKVKVPFEFLISLIRATGAEINPQAGLTNMLASMGAPMFHWLTPNGMPDVASAWTGTNDMIRRWTLADQLTALSSGYLLAGSGSLFAELAATATSPTTAVNAAVSSMLGSSISAGSLQALLQYAQSGDSLGGTGTFQSPTKLDAGLRHLIGAIGATPEFQLR